MSLVRKGLLGFICYSPSCSLQ